MNTATASGARWLILGLPVSLALVFIPRFAAPFSAAKTSIFVLCVCVSAGLGLISYSDLEVRKGEGHLWIAALAFLFIIVVSTIVSPLRYMSLPSVTWIAAGLLLFLAARIALAGKTRVLLLTISVAALWVSLIAIAQFFNINLLESLTHFSSFSGRMRMYSTLGNPNFVAAFLASAIPAPLSLWLTTRHRGLLWAFVALAMVLAIVLTGSRAGLLALVAVGLIFGIVAFQRPAVRWGLFSIVAAGLVLALATQLNGRTAAESARGRIFIWRVALSDGALGSTFGSGPGTFAYLYPAQMGHFFSEPGRESFLHFAGHERYAQNEFVEAWCETGWLGLAALLSVLGIWFRLALHSLRESELEMRPLLLAAVVGVAALCVTALLDFPLHRAETWGLLWLWMAVPFAPREALPSPQIRFVPLRMAGAVLLIVLGVYFSFANATGSYWIQKGAEYERHGRAKLALAAYRSALRWDPFSPDANFNLVRAMAKTGDLTGAIAQSRRADKYVYEPELIILRSRIQQNAERTDDAVRELETGMRMFPYSRELRDEFASYPPMESTAIQR